MALSQRRSRPEPFNGHNQLYISRRPPTSDCSTAHHTLWHERSPFQSPYPLRKPGVSYAVPKREDTHDQRPSMQPQSQQQYQCWPHIQGTPQEPLLQPNHHSWIAPASHIPNQLSSFGPEVAQQSISRSSAGRVSPSNLSYRSDENPGFEHQMPASHERKPILHGLPNDSAESHRAPSIYTKSLLHEQGGLLAEWAEVAEQMRCASGVSASDINRSILESSCLAAATAADECLKHSGNSTITTPCFSDIGQGQTTNRWHEGQQQHHLIQQSQTQPQPQTHSHPWTESSLIRPLSTDNALSIPAEEDWAGFRASPQGYHHQYSPDSSFSSSCCFTPDTIYDPIAFDSPGFQHEMNAQQQLGYFDLNPTRDTQHAATWPHHISTSTSMSMSMAEDEAFTQPPPFTLAPSTKHPTTTTRLNPRRSKHLPPSTTPTTTHRTTEKDAFLIHCKRSGMSYKEIKEKGNFSEAESTLRGRFRTLTKRKEHRVRKPGWQQKDLRLLCDAVRKYASTTTTTTTTAPVAVPVRVVQGVSGRGNGDDEASNTTNIISVNVKSPKISWKQVGEYIWKNGGSYHFGNATCKKKWAQIVQLRQQQQQG
ncbi:hypothetical protein FQN51_001444 [Onygenales sp. PD_10]|nr:hypothetical protein FQN51_001444 [Onygenales sp. PD_10]